MMNVQEIEEAIMKLSHDERIELSVWLADLQAKSWDDQIQHDLDTGKLDRILNEVDAEYDAGKADLL